MANEHESFGNYLRYVRNLRGYTISKLSKLSAVSSSYISRLEDGQRNPTYEVISKLAPALDISSAELLAKADLLTADDLIIVESENTKQIILNLTEGKKRVLTSVDNLSEDTLHLLAQFIEELRKA